MPSQLIGLNNRLTWGQFPVKRSLPPGDGDSGTAAFTQARFNVGGLNLVAVDPGKSADLKLEDKITVVIALDMAASWVASWVKSRPAPEQARLLKHEQGHYDIVALLARDCFEELMPLRQKTYTDAKTMQADVDAVTQRFSPKSQPVQEKYDDVTEHGDKQAIQDSWNRMLRSAADDDLDPATPAVATDVRKKPLLAVLAAGGVNV